MENRSPPNGKFFSFLIDNSWYCDKVAGIFPFVSYSQEGGMPDHSHGRMHAHDVESLNNLSAHTLINHIFISMIENVIITRCAA